MFFKLYLGALTGGLVERVMGFGNKILLSSIGFLRHLRGNSLEDGKKIEVGFKVTPRTE